MASHPQFESGIAFAHPAKAPTAQGPGWVAIARESWARLGEDNIGLIAAGIAFYGLLALFPAIAAIISLWGLLASPGQIAALIANLSAYLPPSAAMIVTQQADALATSTGNSLSLAAIGGIALSLYGAAKGTGALMQGLTIAYEETEQRGFFTRSFVALFLAFSLVLGVIAALACIVALPAFLAFFGLDSIGQIVVAVLRWPLLIALVLFGLAGIYRFAPDRKHPEWQWMSPGALIASGLWMAGTLLFAVYVANFGNYNATYGALGTVIILLTWFWLSAYCILLGAEINSVRERLAPTRPVA